MVRLSVVGLWAAQARLKATTGTAERQEDSQGLRDPQPSWEEKHTYYNQPKSPRHQHVDPTGQTLQSLFQQCWDPTLLYIPLVSLYT